MATELCEFLTTKLFKTRSTESGKDAAEVCDGVMGWMPGDDVARVPRKPESVKTEIGAELSGDGDAVLVTMDGVGLAADADDAEKMVWSYANDTLS